MQVDSFACIHRNIIKDQALLDWPRRKRHTKIKQNSSYRVFVPSITTYWSET